MKKIYVPFDFRCIYKGHYEIEVEDGDVLYTMQQIKEGKIDPTQIGKLIEPERVLKYDESIYDPITEDKYNELIANKNMKEYTGTVTRRTDLIE